MPLFKDSSISKTLEMNIANVKRRSFSIREDYECILNDFLRCWKSKRDKDLLLEHINRERKYFEIFNSSHDSHFVQEMIGLGKTRSKYYHIVSLENSLDMVFSYLCGCDPKYVRQMHRYREVSKSILTLDVNNLDIMLFEFDGLDYRLDKYLLDSYEEDEVECMSKLLTSVCGASYRILTYLSMYLVKNLGLSLRSIGRGKILLSSDFEISENTIELECERFYSSCKININSYEDGNFPNEDFIYGGAL